MAKRRIIEDENFDKSLLDLENWPGVRTESLDEKNREIFQRRKTAIYMYFEGRNHREIEEATGLNRRQVGNFVKKCLKIDDKGVIWGFRALIPYKQTKTYERSTLPTDYDDNNNGAFQLLLDINPSLRDLIDELVRKNFNRNANEKIIRTNYIHRKFIRKCRELKIHPPNYPFNTKEIGRRSVYNYVKELVDRHTGKLNIINDEITPPPMIKRPFERVQFDGHKIDLALALVINTPEGGQIVKNINRIWILTVMDVATRSILGYYVSLNKEYNSSDVLKCFRNSIEPWKPKQFSIPGLEYPEQGGFPSGVIPETHWARWDELLFDNALANLAHMVRERVKEIVGCKVNAGPVGFPLRRSFMERFYGLLEENGFHRLPNTTGSNPNDSRRNKAEKIAEKYRITPEHIEDLAEVLIAEYNGTPHESLSYYSPLESLKQKISMNPLIINQIPTDKRSEVSFLTLQAQRTIKGNVDDKRKPYIEYANVRYTNQVLSRSYGLIGKQLDLVVDIDDIRVIRAYLPDGSELGTLKGAGKWGITPHSLKVRKEIFSLKNKKLLHFTSKDDPIEVYEKFLKEQAKQNKNARNKLGTLEKDLSKGRSIENIIESEQQTLLQDENTTEISKSVTKIRRTSNRSKNKEEKKIRKTIFY